MNKSPTIALLIPAYNAVRFLPRLLGSAEKQVKPFDEIWVYDDCSTDKTADVARMLGARVVRGEVNRGCSHGKNVLAKSTSTDWLHFHDADDELFPNFVSLAHEWMQRARYDVVLFPYEERDGRSGARISVRRFDPTDVMRDPRSYAIREQINPFCGLYRRESFLRAGGYDECPTVLYNEDVAMHIQLAFNGLSFNAETEVAIINHRYSNSMSAANRSRVLEAQYNVMRRTAARHGAERYSAEISSRLWHIAGAAGSHLEWKTAEAAVNLAIQLTGLSSLPPGRLFRALCSISPCGAIRIREYLIRILKPTLRRGYPSCYLRPAPPKRSIDNPSPRHTGTML